MNVKRVTLPKEDFKTESFVQFYFYEEPFFRSNVGSHVGLLLSIFDEFGIKPDVILEEMPQPEDLTRENYRVVGMGGITKEFNNYVLLGKSLGYKIGGDEEHLKSLVPYLKKGIQFNLGGKLYGR